MKNIPSNSQNSFEERLNDNEQFFCSFLDLIPSRIYFNQDDRHNWIHMMQSSSIVKPQLPKNSENESRKKLKTSQNYDFDKLLDDENDFDENLNNEPNGLDEIRPNRFDPKFFKTVSQILKDIEHLNKLNKVKLNKSNNNKQLLNKLKQNNNQENKPNTSIKVLNKSQNKAAKNASAKSGENGEVATSTPNSNSKKAQKRASKFKEAKREAIKRQRQRYDSQTEPQIVNIDHSEAGAKQDRKPILNKNGQVVFSKFDFTADKALSKSKSKIDAHNNKLTPANVKPKDYKKLLKKLQEEKEKKEQLKQVEPEKALELETKAKWKSAIDKASGVKVKDDVEMLKKAVKRIEKKKEKSRKNWDERKKEVEERKNKLQEKRHKNIEKRKEKKKDAKLKRLKKKGRILSAGF